MRYIIYLCAYILACLPHILALQETIYCDVVIVGGGLGGLYSADILGSKQYQTCVFEKENRWGGRYLDVFYEGIQEPIGVGGWRVDQSHTKMWRLIDKLNIETIPWSKKPTRWEARGAIVNSTDELKQEVYPTLVGLQDLHFPISEELRTYPNTYSYILEQRGQEGVSYMQDTNFGFRGDLWDTDVYTMAEHLNWEDSDTGNVSRPIKGLTMLTNALAQRVAAAGALMYKNQEVLSIYKWKNSYVVNTKNYKAITDAIILTATPIALKRIEGELVRAIIAQREFKSIYPQLVFKGGAVYASAWWEPYIKTLQLYQSGSTCIGSILPAPSRGKNGEALVHHVYSDGPCAQHLWKDLSQYNSSVIDKVVKKKLEYLFPGVDIPDPLLSAYHFWVDGGWHYSHSGYNVTLASVQAWAVNPLDTEKIFLVGESYAIRRAWGEGALATAENALKAGWGINV